MSRGIYSPVKKMVLRAVILVRYRNFNENPPRDDRV